MRVSYSRLNQYRMCPANYKKRYVDDDRRRETDNPLLLFGSLLHECAKDITDFARGKQEISEDDVMKIYDNAWKKPEYQRILGADQERYGIGAEMIRNFGIYIVGIQEFILEPEYAFGFEGDFKVGKHEIMGVIDRVDLINEDTVKVTDYKSGLMIPSKDEVHNDLQLGLYALVCRELLPYRNFMVSIHLLYHSFAVTVEKTSEELDNIYGYVENLCDTMEKDKECKPKLNMYCSTCIFKGKCDLYQKAVKQGIPIVKELPDNIKDLAMEYWNIKNNIKIFDARAEELKDVMEKVVIENGEQIVGDHKYSIAVSDATSYIMSRVIEAFGTIGKSMSDMKDLGIFSLSKRGLNAFNKKSSKTLPPDSYVAFQEALKEAEVQGKATKLSIVKVGHKMTKKKAKESQNGQKQQVKKED